MKTLTIRFERVRGLAFGSAMINNNSYDSLDDVKEYPFDFTSSMVCGPNKYWAEDGTFKVLIDGLNESDYPVSNVKQFTSNKDIDNSGIFNTEQASYVKKEIKSYINQYYKSWRSGQSFSNDDLLEVIEEGKGEIFATLQIDSEFDTERLFFIVGDNLSNRESVISSVGYLNTNGEITYGDFEYDDYRFTFSDISINGQSLDM